MSRNLTKLILRWRETANKLLAHDPDDRAGQGLIKCAIDLEAE